ncbi:hypothetical protein A4R44_01973 [Amycolatopsis sp. M39]|nr:hypothetical protein A4R44_01973 [Amycolatopsis sp. M39]
MGYDVGVLAHGGDLGGEVGFGAGVDVAGAAVFPAAVAFASVGVFGVQGFAVGLGDGTVRDGFDVVGQFSVGV